jgi:cytoskeletal protein RodZ
VTRPNLLVGALAAVCVGMLLWCARLILAADLPRGAHVASWALWVFATVAVLTLIAYVREFLVHRQAVGRDASWKPLPSLVLLWIGGLTALLSFAFILPDKSHSDGAGAPSKAGTSLTSQTVTPASTSATPRGSPTTSGTASRSAPRTKAPSSTSTSAAAGTSPTPEPTSSGSSTASATPTTSTTTPIIDLDILPTQARPTTPPGH